MRTHVWLTIGGMAVVTYLTRAPLMLALARRPLPPRLRLWLRLIPLAVLPALAIPMVLFVSDEDGGRRLATTIVHPPLWGAIAVFALAAARVNLLVCVAAGVGLVALLRALT